MVLAFNLIAIRLLIGLLRRVTAKGKTAFSNCVKKPESVYYRIFLLTLCQSN